MIRVLVLEDNLKALKIITEIFGELEAEFGETGLTIFSEGNLAEKFLENFDVNKFDLILLDYFSSDDKNFHQVVFSQVDPKKVIAISSLSSRNLEAQEKGVSRSVEKNYADLIDFKKQLKKEIKAILNY